MAARHGDPYRTHAPERLDGATARLAARVRGLRGPRTAAFFACAGERLLGLYSSFQEEASWGDAEALLDALNDVWRYLQTGALPGPALAERLEAATPHVDDFDALRASFAQDAVICVDVAVRCCASSESEDTKCVEYALDPVRRVTCLEEMGYLDVGSSEEEIWQRKALMNPRLRSEFAYYNDLVARLESAIFTPERAVTLRQAAETQRLKYEELIANISQTNR